MMKNYTDLKIQLMIYINYKIKSLISSYDYKHLVDALIK